MFRHSNTSKLLLSSSFSKFSSNCSSIKIASVQKAPFCWWNVKYLHKMFLKLISGVFKTLVAHEHCRWWHRYVRYYNQWTVQNLLRSLWAGSSITTNSTQTTLQIPASKKLTRQTTTIIQLTSKSYDFTFLWTDACFDVQK